MPICWGIMNKYFLILWILPVSGFGWNWCQNWRLYFVHNVCKWQEFLCFYTAVEAIFSAVCDHFWTKTSFSTSSFWGSNYHFLDDLDYLLCNVGVSFWFYPIEIHCASRRGFLIFPNFDLTNQAHMTLCTLSESWVWEFEISTFFVNIFKNEVKIQKNEKTPPRQFYLGFWKSMRAIF